ncbi:MAG: winged helix-turn-helix transcriptional regulator [Candidatus Helarchaeota archaeon]|nr:winged helix-turn-helix transcriptional regulator [Candidatus Helarchaeota archaeon]
MDYQLLGDISQVEKNIIEIILKLKEDRKQFTFNRILKACKSRLSYSEDEIFFNLQKLYEKNILVEYRQLVKTEILENHNRKLIYHIINENPGIHLSELVQQTDIPLQTCSWHLTILQEFNMIKAIRVKNRYCFANVDISNDDLEIFHLLRNDLNKSVLKEISQNSQITFSNLSKKLDIAPSTLHYHINELKNARLISTSKEGTSQIFKICYEGSVQKLLINSQR